MIRYLRASFLIGAPVAFLAGGAAWAGLFEAADRALRSLLGLAADAPDVIHQDFAWILPAVLALLAAWVTVDVPKLSLKVVVIAAAVLEIVASPYVFALYGRYFSPFAPGFAVALVFLCGLLYARTEAGGRKLVLRNVIGDRLALPGLRSLIDQGEPLALSGKKTEGTVVCAAFFLGHDAPSELDPSVEVDASRRFLDAISSRLLEAGGYLESIEARSIRAIFSPDMLVKDHAAEACKAAIALDRALANVATDIQQEIHFRIPYGIGVESGQMLMSAVGGGAAGGVVFSSTAAEIASRLAQRNAAHGSHVIAGPECYLEAESKAVFRPLEVLPAPDSATESSAVIREVYEVVAVKSDAQPNVVDGAQEFWRATVLQRRGDRSAAIAAYRKACELAGTDEVIRKRLEALGDTDPLPALPAPVNTEKPEEKLLTEPAATKS